MGANGHRSSTRQKPETAHEGFPRRLEAILRALPDSELTSLVSRMGIKIDGAKRIDAASQAARALVGLPDVRDPSRLPTASCELLHRIAEAGGVLTVGSLTPALEPLIGRGIVYGRRSDEGVELVLPIAFLVQLKSWESEDPRALRALLAQAPFETVSAVAAHYLGRPATPPVALSLEQAWESLSDPDVLAEEIDKLAPLERRLLESIEAVGGEVETQELLDLEREPMRLRGAQGVTASRRGVGFALERRAFLIPIHPNRHVVPTEVALVVGAERRRARESRREQIRSFVIEEDHAPRRARFASDPAILAVALAFAAREPGGGDTRPGIGTPRSLLLKLSQRFGRDMEASALITALSRAIGLWDASAASAASPPGSYAIHALPQVLFRTWRHGGAWDEARAEHEVFRLSSESRDSSPIGALREMVLDALQDLGEGSWIPWPSLHGYLSADERIPGLERLLRRWAERASVEPPEVLEVARRIVLETLPALGIIDLGGDPEDKMGTALRLTPRGRALLTGGSPADPTASEFVDTYSLQVGTSACTAHVLSLAQFAEIGRVDTHLELLLTAPSIARALSAGVESDVVRARIEAIAPLPEKFSRMLTQASVIIGRGTAVAASAFLWVEDLEIRELLRTKRPASELFVDPSPPGGLLVLPDVDGERLVRKCRALGVEIEIEGGAARVRTSGQMPAVDAPRTATRGRSKTPINRTR